MILEREMFYLKLEIYQYRRLLRTSSWSCSPRKQYSNRQRQICTGMHGAV